MIQLIQHSLGDDRVARVPGVEDGKADLVWCDPPYNIGVKYADDNTRDRLPIWEYSIWAAGVVRQLSMGLRPGGTFWWLCPADHVSFMPDILNRLVGPQLYCIVKEETFAQYQQKTLTEDYRFLFCNIKRPEIGPSDWKLWGKDLLTFNPDAIRIPSARLLQKKPDKRADPRGRVPGRIWRFRRLQGTSDDRVDWHPAQLPPELLDRVVKGWTNEGDKVIDGFAGSGNMGLCCRRLKRNAILIDQSPTYIKAMGKRLGL